MDEKTKYAGDHFIKNIAFFGDADISETDETYKAAFDVAEALALEGYVVVDGGGPGVMEAATSGAEKGGGKTRKGCGEKGRKNRKIRHQHD